MGMVSKVKVLFTMPMAVIEHDGSGARMSIRYEHIQMDMDAPMFGKVTYDSDDPSASSAMMGAMFDEVMGALLDAEITATYDELGKMVSMTGFDLSGLSSGGQGDPASSAMQGLSYSFAPLPKKKVGVGDSWDTEMDIGGFMKAPTTYTVDRITDDNVYLKLDGTITGSRTEEGAEITISGTQTGTTVIERATGMALESNIKQDLDMNVSQMGMKQSMNTISNVTVKTTPSTNPL